jgi:hypothetical protein
MQSNRAAFALAALAIVAGVFLRFYALDRQSVWNDEAFTVQNITRSWHEAAYQPMNNHPPFYFAQLRLWSRLGGAAPRTIAGLSFLRANAALWGSISLALFFLLARRFFDPWLSAAAVAIMALSPLHLAFSQDARPYTLALAEGLAGFLLIERMARSTRWLRLEWPGLGVLWALELYTHYWGLFIATAQLVYGLTSVQDRKRRLYFGLAFSAALLAFSAWWPVLDFHLHEKPLERFELLGPRLWDLARTFSAFSGVYFQSGNQMFVYSWPVWLTAIFIALMGYAFLRGVIKGPSLARWWLAIGVGAPFLISYWQPMFLWYRYPFLSYGAFVLCLVCGLSLVPSRRLRGVLILFILAAEAAGCYHYFHGWQKGNAKAAIECVHRLQTDTSIIVRPGFFGDVMSFYDSTPASRLMDEAGLDSPDKRSELSGKCVIFIAFDGFPDPVGEAIKSELPVRSKNLFPAIPRYGITVWKLGAPR